MPIKNDSKKYKHAERAAWRRVEKEGVVLDLESSEYFSLNEIGVLVWENIGSGATIDKIAKTVEDEYDVTGDQARKDIDALVRELLKKKLIEEKK
ncbi:MAG: PqqD family protein [Elusimicrobiota bacterium]